MICRHVGQAQTPREESIFYLSQEKKIVAACVDGCPPDWLWWLLYNVYKRHIVMLFTWTNIMIYVNCISVTTTKKPHFPFGNEKVARKLFCQVCKCHLTWLKKKKIKSHPIPIGVGVAWFKNLAQYLSNKWGQQYDPASFQLCHGFRRSVTWRDGSTTARGRTTSLGIWSSGF